MSEVVFTKFEGDKQVILDASSLSALMACPQYYKYSVVDALRRGKGKTTTRWGTAYHDALEVYDTAIFNGIPFKKAQEAAVMSAFTSAKEMEDIDDDNSRSPENLVRAVVWYTDTYRKDPLTTVTLPDGSPAIETRFELAIPNTDYRMSGRIDKLVVDDFGQIVIVDRKTTGQTLGPKYWSYFEIDIQIMTYIWAMQYMFDDSVDHLMIDACQTAVGFNRFERRRFFKTKDEIKEFVDALPFWLSVMERCLEDDKWPMNPTSCGMYGGCDFVDVCKLPPRLRADKLQNYRSVRKV